ncbi:hypothetical protein LIER_09721 [Lithospermum erythrorhizon]|uniref:Uncharacterized protein n=1 Tax=Lithospermum erythrorhizon TaxID=34254 RepID=A0AAV3PIP3_LITER
MSKQEDDIVGLASSLTYPRAEIKVPVYEKWVLPPMFEAQEYEEEEKEESMAISTTSSAPTDWRQPLKTPRRPLKEGRQHGRLPEDLRKKLAEAFNKTLYNILKHVVSKSKKNWHKKIEEELWAYRTMHRTSTQATPYALVYAVIAVFPLEVQIPSLRVALNEGFTQEEAMQLRLQELDLNDEQSLQAHQRLQCYQSRISKSYNKKMVPKWDGKYVVQEAYTSGSYLLADQEGHKVGSINNRYLKQYYS